MNLRRIVEINPQSRPSTPNPKPEPDVCRPVRARRGAAGAMRAAALRQGLPIRQVSCPPSPQRKLGQCRGVAAPPVAHPGGQRHPRRLRPGSQGQSMALTVLVVPYSLNAGWSCAHGSTAPRTTSTSSELPPLPPKEARAMPGRGCPTGCPTDGEQRYPHRLQMRRPESQGQNMALTG